jgi:hypothetical protein
MKRFGLWTTTDGKNPVAADVRTRISSRFGPASFDGHNFQTRSSCDVSVQRHSQRTQRIPIVFLSVYATEEEQRVPIRVGAVQIPPKPVSKKRTHGRGRSSARIPCN